MKNHYSRKQCLSIAELFAFCAAGTIGAMHGDEEAEKALENYNAVKGTTVIILNMIFSALGKLFAREGSEGKVGDTPEGGSSTIIKNGRISVDDIIANPKALSGKSTEQIAQMLRDSGYDVTIRNSTRSRSGAQVIQINNPGNGKNISQVQVSPGGGRHGSSPYIKISTTDQGIIKIVDGPEASYITDGKETATIIFTGGN